MYFSAMCSSLCKMDSIVLNIIYVIYEKDDTISQRSNGIPTSRSRWSADRVVTWCRRSDGFRGIVGGEISRTFRTDHVLADGGMRFRSQSVVSIRQAFGAYFQG